MSAVTSGEGQTGIPQGDLLIEFADAVLGVDDKRLAAARAAIVDTMGEAALVDAAGIVGTFNGIDRVADATGAPLEDWKADETEAMRAELGIDAFAAIKADLEEASAS